MTAAPGPSTADVALTELAMSVAREAAAMATGRMGDELRWSTKSTDVDLVTEVDEASEQLITERLLAARPDDGIRGEEGTGIEGASGVDWVVDPIDGTTSFFYGLPGWSVSIAAQRAGRTVAGAVVAPVSGWEFAATLGAGATCNGRPATCRPTVDLAHALVATGFAADAERRTRQGAVFAAMIGEIRDIRRMGSAALDLCAVAAGSLDAYWEVGLNPWDHAAGVLIAAEAGAVVRVQPDRRAGRDVVIAAAPGIATAFDGLLDRCGAVDV